MNTGFPAANSTTLGQAWWQPNDQDQRGVTHWAEDLWAESMAYEGQQDEGGGVGAQQTDPVGQVPEDSAGTVASEAPKDPHAGEAGHWVDKNGDPVLSPYGSSTFWLTVDKWKPDIPPDPVHCCCCVKDVYVDSSPGPHRGHRFGDIGAGQRIGNKFKIVAVLGHTGKGEVCKCTMTWQEYANQKYTPPGGKARTLPGRKWHEFQDKGWNEKYGNKKDVECVDKKVEFSIDEPGPSLPIDENGVWELWIQVCVKSCPDADCKCDPKEKCVHVHQVVTQTGPREADPVMEVDRIRDGTKFKEGKVKAPPEEPPGGWRK